MSPFNTLSSIPEPMGRTANWPDEHTHTLQVPHPRCLPDGGAAETRKAPSFEGASAIFGAGQKKSGLSLSGASGDRSAGWGLSYGRTENF